MELINKRLTLVEEAKYLAIATHGNQTYDGKHYFYHLEQVVAILKHFGYTEDKYVISGFLHDTLEDGALSYSKIKKQFGEEIAEIVYSVSDELGRNRKEKKAKTYPKIKANPDAIIIKMADRIANVSNSLKTSNTEKLKMYTEEHKEFTTSIYDRGVCDPMFNYLGKLIFHPEQIVM